jgi:short-subunit dehydrogenase
VTEGARRSSIMNKKVVLITGASSGIGRETAQLLLSNDFTVYAGARRTDKMQGLKDQGANVLQMDITNDDSLTGTVDNIMTSQGRIDVLINNAGFGLCGAVEDVSLSDARYQMEVNVFGPARLTQLVLPHMRKQRSGRIVNVTSIGGKVSTPISGWYHASKFAVEGLCDSLRMEVKPFGIDVIIIEPGSVKSEWAGIAIENMDRVSGNTAYRGLSAKTAAFLKKSQPKHSHPAVIADLIVRVINTKRPKTRYHAGYMSGAVLFMRKLLSDRLMDKMILSQLK